MDVYLVRGSFNPGRFGVGPEYGLCVTEKAARDTFVLSRSPLDGPKNRFNFTHPPLSVQVMKLR